MWNPSEYLHFGDHRGRPFFELCARIRATAPRTVVDLGCGPGNLTTTLAQRWPRAQLVALDSAPEMVTAARENGIDARLGAIEQWQPDDTTDVIVSNAALQWVPEHERVVASWLAALTRDSWVAFQVPGNLNAASHRAIRELVASPTWRAEVGDLTLRGPDTVAEPQAYGELLSEADTDVDVWETTYYQRLTGADPVLAWVRATALTPVRAALPDTAFEQFCAELAPILRAAYPTSADGSTVFPFRRIFAVAHKR